MNFVSPRHRLAVEIGPILEQHWTGIPVFTRRLITALRGHGGVELDYVYDMCVLPEGAVLAALREGTGTFLRTFFEGQHPGERRLVDPAVPLLYPSVKTSFGLAAREASVVHDLSTLFMPENHEDANIAHHLDGLAHELASNEVTFCVSDATEAALQGAFPSTRGRTAPLLQYVDWPREFETMARNLRPLSLGRYAVVVGTVEPRKNLTLLIDALAHEACRDSDLRFIVIGRKGWKVDAFLAELTDAQRARLHFSGFVSEFAKYRLIRGAEFLVFPSVYEGFGIPALEAMSLGKPVVAARTSSFPEVVGPAGVFFDPLDVDDFVTALADIEQPERLAELAPHARAHAATFGPERMAAPVLAWLAGEGAGALAPAPARGRHRPMTTPPPDASDLAPIAVLSFNRPAMLRTVLESLMAQRDAQIEHRRIVLFQDGAVNRWSRLRYAQDDDIRDCIEVFRAVCPEGEVMASADNIGVCENMLRAEEHMFETLGAPIAYFFEDDLLLSPAYVRMLDRLAWYSRGARIVAYFAAYGDYYADEAHIDAHRDECMTLDHHWGFGLFRHHWARIRANLEDYYAIVRGRDYARRDHHAVYDLYRTLGLAPRGTSQDAAKAIACARLGLWRCRTVLPFARYIGDTGAHMSPEQFAELGFARTVMADTPLERIRFPDEDRIREHVEADARFFADIHRDELPGLRGGIAHELDHARLCTRDDIVHAYNLILHRDPEGESVFSRHEGRRSVFEFVQSLIDSDEHKLLAARATS